MAKKKKRKSTQYSSQPKKTSMQSQKKSKFPLIALAVGAAVLISGVFFMTQGEKPRKPSQELTKLKKENINLREKRPTLSPQKFSGKVRRAYEIAREIPEVLDRL